jgi:hypothetical protein
MTDAFLFAFTALRGEIDDLKQRTLALEVKEVEGTDSNSAISEKNEHQRKLDELRADLEGKLELLSSENNELRADLQGTLDLLSAENNGLKERIRVLEGQELRKDVGVIDVELEVGTETTALDRRPSVIATSLRALEDTEDAAETEEHELGDSMWDACLFLGCKDEFKLKGDSMNVGNLVTIFGVLALVLNMLIQTAIVAVVVYKMADNADIKERTIADMRRVAHACDA